MKRFLVGAAEALSDDEVAIVAITSGVKRDGDEWLPGGCDLTAYSRNPVVCFAHDTTQPIGLAAVALVGGQIAGRVQFAPLGISETADRCRGLAKAGILSGVSAGIDALEVEPLRTGGYGGGVRVVRSELLEISLVSVPADTEARITQRSRGFRSMMTRGEMHRRFPISRDAVDRFMRAFEADPAERLLIQVARDHGETLTPFRIAEIRQQAARIGKTPAQHYIWCNAVSAR